MEKEVGSKPTGTLRLREWDAAGAEYIVCTGVAFVYDRCIRCGVRVEINTDGNGHLVEWEGNRVHDCLSSISESMFNRVEHMLMELKYEQGGAMWSSFWEGYRARISGHPKHSCPYDSSKFRGRATRDPILAPCRKAWRDGWTAGMEP